MQKSFHWTRLLGLLDVMYKYEMDPASILKDTEQTPFCPQTDRLTDMQTEYSTTPIRYLSNSLQVCGMTKYLVHRAQNVSNFIIDNFEN